MNEKSIPQVANTPAWEKILGLIGFVLLCSGFAYLSWRGLNEQQEPPQISVNLVEVNELKFGYLVQVEVVNDGSQSVAELQLEGSLQPAIESTGTEPQPEVSQATIDYVPAHSKKSAGLFFASDPRNGGLTLKPLGYRKP